MLPIQQMKDYYSNALQAVQPTDGLWWPLYSRPCCQFSGWIIIILRPCRPYSRRMACDGHYSEAMLPTEQINNYYSKVLQTIQVRPRSLCKRGMAIVLGKVTAYTTEDGYFSDAMLPLQPTDGHYCEEVQPMPHRDVHYFQIFTSSLQNKDERTGKKK